MSLSTARQISLPLAIAMTLGMVIVVREGAWLLCRELGYESASNIVGMLILFVLLMAWRWLSGLPNWLNRASGILLADSAFAFLPVSAGAGILMLKLGDEFWGITVTILVCTLIPLWAMATLANQWLKDDDQTDSNLDNESGSEPDSQLSKEQVIEN